jgi:pimeloyl-ACP methyl ester carboxylesterase
MTFAKGLINSCSCADIVIKVFVKSNLRCVCPGEKPMSPTMSPFKALLILTGALSSVACAELIQTPVKPKPAIAQSPPSLKSYLTKTIPCPAVLPAETEGKTVTCGVLTVPENYDQPNGRQVEISYARFYSKSLSPLPDPVFYLHGGPGGSTIQQLDGFSKIFAPHRQTRDVVLFDQRGTQYSSQLGCAPTAFTLDAIGGNIFDQYVKEIADDEPLTDDRMIAQYAICAQLLQKHGFDLSQFSTPNNARDTVNLAAALGYKQINLYGISYGTYLAMAIARNHPNVVRSVVLDSTATPSVNKYSEGARRVVTPMVNLLKDCEADAACNQAYPNLQTRLNVLLEKLVKEPIPLPKVASSTAKAEAAEAAETSITLNSFARNAPGWLNQQPSFAAYLPLMISELERGITTTYEQALSGKLFQGDPKPESVELAAHYRKLASDFEIKAQELLTAKATTAQQERPSIQWILRVQEQLKMLPEANQDRAIKNLYGVGYESGRMRDRSTLMTFTTETFPTETTQSLSAELQTMPEAEIRRIYEVLSEMINQVSTVDQGSTSGMHNSVDCREQVSWFSQADADAVYRSLPLPLLAQPSQVDMLEQVAICKHWPVKPADPSEHQVVKISIPTLVMQGRYDAATSSDRGIQAMEWLTNGTYVEFPSLGHGVTTLSQCGRDIGIAFIDRPKIAPNTSCTEALKPKFVLPPASAQ